jgi:hypothetical protein
MAGRVFHGVVAMKDREHAHGMSDLANQREVVEKELQEKQQLVKDLLRERQEAEEESRRLQEKNRLYQSKIEEMERNLKEIEAQDRKMPGDLRDEGACNANNAKRLAVV